MMIEHWGTDLVFSSAVLASPPFLMDAQQHKTASVTRAQLHFGHRARRTRAIHNGPRKGGLGLGSTGDCEGLVPRVMMPLYFEAEHHRGRGVTTDAERAEPTAPPDPEESCSRSYPRHPCGVRCHLDKGVSMGEAEARKVVSWWWCQLWWRRSASLASPLSWTWGRGGGILHFGHQGRQASCNGASERNQ